MGTKGWQFIGVGLSVPMMGWALTEYFDGKLWVTVVAFCFAIALGCVCLIGLILAAMKDRRVKAGLANFIEEMHAMQAQCGDPAQPAPDIQDISARLTVFLRRELGQEAILRLNSNAGLPGLILAAPVSEAHKNTWKWLENRSCRLHELIREASGARP